MYMLKYIIKRVLLMFLTLFIIMTMCFVLVKLLPSLPTDQYGKDKAVIEARRELMGYDEPIMAQYKYFLFGRTTYTYDVLDKNGNKIQKRDEDKKLVWLQTEKRDENGKIVYVTDSDGNYVDRNGQATTDPNAYVVVYVNALDENGKKIPVYESEVVYKLEKVPEGVEYVKGSAGGMIRADFGVSEVMYIGRDVWEVFASKLPFTMAVNLYSIFLSIPIGLGLGIYAALKKNKWQDHLISTGVMVFVSVPSFIYGFLVLYLFYFKLGWFSATMDATQGAFSWVGFKSMIPAVLSLSFGSIAGFARYTRAELTEVLTNEFMLLARTKGLTRGQATFRHALRNAMVPIFPMILGEFVSILSGSLILENMFSIPGVGKLYVNSVQSSPPDYNVFMLLCIFYTFVGLAVGIVVDISYGIIDPRIRMGAR